MQVTLASLLAVAVAASARPADNFLGSCDANSVVINGRFIQANCKNILGSWGCTRLDMNNCLKNNYGRIQEDPSGQGPHYNDECINCSNAATTSGLLVSGPTLLHCQCDPKTGASQTNWPQAVFDINTIVDNVNGNLECYNTKGSKC